jgi:PKHD-type hydroxylase
MFLVIPHVLNEVELQAAREHLAAASAVFEPGSKTAGAHARAVKSNEQAEPAAVEGLLKKIGATLMAHPVFKAAAQPKTLVRMMVSRYRPGMHYGTHVDDAVMQGLRTDLSFTLFLADPDTYSGGELLIEENDGERSFKLAAGDLILYPTTTLHQVAAVGEGERLAVVGWVRSYLRESSERELLFDLENVIASLRQSSVDRAILDRLYKIRGNLLRKWVED